MNPIKSKIHSLTNKNTGLTSTFDRCLQAGFNLYSHSFPMESEYPPAIFFHKTKKLSNFVESFWFDYEIFYRSANKFVAVYMSIELANDTRHWAFCVVGQYRIFVRHVALLLMNLRNSIKQKNKTIRNS